ncbi:extracellular solute-binding protein [Atopobacter phocae]|uniref:extracellular solute-binding protein n=1 Tax=Atopobacter phocae TaxID=136492 RepID=UPI00046E6BE5|nr:extracellular solute-binding protein [Atopobacter phocae]
METFWKKVALGTVTTLSAVTLVACGSNNAKKDSKEAGKDDKTLVVSAAGLSDYVKDNIEEFEKANDVKVEVLDADMFEKLEGLNLDGPAGTAPDVLIAPYDRIGSLAQTGQISEVKLIDDANYDETDKRQVTMDGKIYGAPAVIETLVMYYNKDLLSEAPKTFEELEGLSKDAKYNFADEAGKNTAFLAKWTDFYFAYGLISGYGGYVFGENGTDTKDLGLNKPESIEGIQYAVDWFQKVWPQGMLDVKSAGDFVSQSFTEGKTAAVISGPWDAASFKDAGVNYGVSKIPTLPNGKEYAPFAGGKGWIISSYSKKQDLAQKFLDWASSEEQQTKMYEKLGEIPANQVARQKAADTNNELTTAVIDVYANAVPMPNIPEMGEVWSGAENLMFDAASGNKSAKQSADDAVELIKQSIEQKHQ